MSLKRIVVATLKVSAIALVALGLSERTASAQSLTAEFSIPYEVGFGKSVVLPAGQYRITIDGAHRPLVVRGNNGRGALVMPVSVNAALADRPTSLILARSGSGRDVRVLNLREANLSLVFSVSNPERKLASTVDASATVADVARK